MALLTKRDQPMDDGLWPPVESKKGKFVAGPSFGAPPPRVGLNPADCDLDFNIEDDGLHGWALCEKGFAYCWSAARANVGIFGGKYCFGCKIVAHQPVEMDDTPRDLQHLCRVGVSLGDDALGSLGGNRSSFGFGGAGELPNSGSCPGYLEKFMPGDTIICCVDLNSIPAVVCFAKNGQFSGIAKQFDAGACGLGVAPTQNLALFPHIWLKNVVVQMQFSAQDGLVIPEGYRPWSSAFEDGKGILGPVFPNLIDCEVIMMVGLPASGKSTWAENWVKGHPEKRYVLLGTNLALDKMKVRDLKFSFSKNSYSSLHLNKDGERFEWLMDRATKIFNTLLSRASKMPRNVIIDEPNVFLNSRRRRMKPFADYQKIAVVVFPKLEELKERAEKRFQRLGNEVPAETVNKMLVDYTLPLTKDMPYTDEYFDELNRIESEICLSQMKRDPTLYGTIYCKTGRGFGYGANSYFIQTPSEALSRNTFSNPPGYHLQYGGNDAERRFALTGSMTEQPWGYRPGDTFTSADNRSRMNEPYGYMNPAPYQPRYPYASQFPGGQPQPFTARPGYPAEPYDPLHGSPIPRPPYGNAFPDGDVGGRGFGRG
ncbi:OLC1v1021730C2 [Oldenlandia corymbosa var. corymbosa]|uniref:OLC1v1021730C2 n=1 Tax=Oldenlandia corymbosa var. corymbosa TaxID=529605 RepID=A0AAV1BXM4_OLDCO|nr:OLC1v1021730C2 [Oldenlandia corymbosa var. corymbosa]